jgi:hypothetical protein
VLLFYITKDLEDNINVKNGVLKAVHRLLWELLPVFEHTLLHFKKLEKPSKGGKFNNHPGI